MDLDFERAVRPPPQPTEEVTASLEDLIRARIAEHNFDDVLRVAPPAPERKAKMVDLDDKKSGKVRQLGCTCTASFALIILIGTVPLLCLGVCLWRPRSLDLLLVRNNVRGHKRGH